MTRFVVCGETLIDLVPAPGPNDHFRSTWLALSAGGPMNSAVALGRLGADTHYLGRISRDAFGTQLRGHITDAGVHLDLATESSQATSLAVVSLNEEGVASYTFHFADTANFGWQIDDLPALGEGDWLHIASLATVVSPGAEVLLSWVEQTAVAISYDINVRPTVISEPEAYWERVKPWLRAVGRRAGVVKASDADVEFLAKADAGGDPVEVAAGWVEQFGLGMAVITLGPGGGVAITPDGERLHVPGYPTEVVDTVGAGDTFMAGFLDGHVRLGQELTAALRRGAAAASIVCSRQGAQPPTADEVDALLAARA
ncbi:MAG: PfkB family carbohydrate kinase [Actinomycetes bacterium]